MEIHHDEKRLPARLIETEKPVTPMAARRLIIETSKGRVLSILGIKRDEDAIPEGRLVGQPSRVFP